MKWGSGLGFNDGAPLYSILGSCVQAELCQSFDAIYVSILYSFLYDTIKNYNVVLGKRMLSIHIYIYSYGHH